ncbi:hypothetical protein EIP91_011457 [Steccherinum ochraceum]|uniref:Protein kinase domain-containing protein n=1 Tax=Steccherinum ochraceum TaxID=92696 RepID=A0A4R0RRU6_9APHY|nr:hypothetical protein EIP91_011457 [Steccherinum ochraceum]
MSPSILPHKSRSPPSPYVISAPIEGSFVDFSKASSATDKSRLTPPPKRDRLRSFGSKTPLPSPAKLPPSTPKSKSGKRSPSISAPVQGSFKHIGHMTFDTQHGYTTAGVDPSWHSVIHHLEANDSSAAEYGAAARTHLNVNTKILMRPRRLSEPEMLSPIGVDITSSAESSSGSGHHQHRLNPSAAYGKLNSPSAHRPTQSFDYNPRLGRTGMGMSAVAGWHPRPQQRMNGNVAEARANRTPRWEGPGSVVRSTSAASVPEVLRPSMSLSQQSSGTRPSGLMGGNEKVTPAPGTVDMRGGDAVKDRRRMSRSVDASSRERVAATLRDGSVGPTSPERHLSPEGSRRRPVRRKAVPKLELSDEENDVQATPRRRANKEQQQQPRPTGRYFDSEAPIKDVYERTTSSSSTEWPESNLKRQDEVFLWRKEMQRKSELYEQEHQEGGDDLPPLPLSTHVHGASLSIRDRVMRCIRAALESGDYAELSQLDDEDAQFAVDTVWQMPVTPLPSRITSEVPSTLHHQLQRAHLRRLAFKLVLHFDRMPAALFLSGVQCHDREASIGGRFADVYRGTFGNLQVALKSLNVLKTSNAAKVRSRRQAFYRESLLWQDLSHPHILPYLGVGILEHSVCMVLPWMENGNIMNHMDNLKQQGKLTAHNHNSVVNEWCYQVALGLEYLHSEGIVHGDLRGASVLVDDDGNVRLTDFGMSAIAAGTTHGSERGDAKRWLAPELISPEQFDLSSGQLAYAGDMYAFAFIAMEIFTGNPPFTQLSEHQTIHHVLQGHRPRRPSLFEGAVVMSDPLWKVTTVCGSHHPSHRPSAASVVLVLETADRERLC